MTNTPKTTITMNRENKFRAWDTRIDTMYPFVILTWNGGIEARLDPKDPYSIKDITIHHANGEHDDYSENYIKVMQFTGLLDKNGKDIYEGDIVFCLVNPEDADSGGNRIIKFDGEFRFSVCEKENNFGLPMLWGGYKSLEVIGNIHQNPELL